MKRRPQPTGGPPVRWPDAIAELRGAAITYRAGKRLDPIAEGLANGFVRRLAGAELPLEGESARELKKAFVALARAMLLAAGERRVALAVAFVAVAETVETLLEDNRRQAAAGWQRQFTD